MESVIKITRETVFYQGYIRFKMSVNNESPYVVNDVTLDFIYDEKLLYIPKEKEENNVYPVSHGKFVIGNIFGKKSKTFTILFEPLTCAKAADIKCQVSYADYEGTMFSEWMEPKEISVVCPMLETKSNINIGSLKHLIEKLPTKDSRVFAIENSFDLKRLETLSREVIEKHDVCHVSTLHTRDGKICEIWYHGTTKITKNDIVIKVSILFEEQILELFAATQDAKILTGLLAEVGRELKETVESRISGKGKSINLTIKDSVVQRSNLLDMCNIDGTCDMNVIIEDSVVQRSSIAYEDKEARLRQEQEGVERCKQEKIIAQAASQKAAEGAEKKRKEEERRLRAQAEMKKLEEERLRKEQERQEIKRRTEVERKKQGENSVSTPVNRRKLMFIPVMFIIILAGYWMFSPLLVDNSDNQGAVVSQNTKVVDSPLAATETNNVSTENKTATTNTQPDLETYTNSVGMEFVLIPSGEFQMGSNDGEYDETPVHEVTIENAYYLGKYEVTQAQWVAIMGDNPSWFDGDNNPVEQVSWNNVQEFVKKLNAKEGTDKYRLPSNAEWEYACRAGTSTCYSFGENESKLGDYAWYNGNSEDSTHPVGQKKHNPWGLYDMYGNVEEWCQDNWDTTYENAPTDGSALDDGSSSLRVVRGSGWTSIATNFRSDLHTFNFEQLGTYQLGFRLLREV